jgi:hypothetical protein
MIIPFQGLLLDFSFRSRLSPVSRIPAWRQFEIHRSNHFFQECFPPNNQLVQYQTE